MRSKFSGTFKGFLTAKLTHYDSISRFTNMVFGITVFGIRKKTHKQVQMIVRGCSILYLLLDHSMTHILSFRDAVRYYTSSYFGWLHMTNMAGYFQCYGSEENLDQCRHEV